VDTPAERHERPEPCADLPDEPSADEQLVTRRLGVGWGVAGETDETPSDDLQAVELPIQPDAVMADPATYGENFKASDMLGAGPLEGGLDTATAAVPSSSAAGRASARSGS